MKKTLVIIVVFACIFGYRKVYADDTTKGQETTKTDIKALLKSFFNDSAKMSFTSDARLNLMGMMVAEGTEEIEPMKELLGSMEADIGSVNIEKVKVTSNSAIALVTGVKKQDYEKMNFMDVFELSYVEDEWKIKTLIAFLDEPEEPTKEEQQT